MVRRWRRSARAFAAICDICGKDSWPAALARMAVAMPAESAGRRRPRAGSSRRGRCWREGRAGCRDSAQRRHAPRGSSVVATATGEMAGAGARHHDGDGGGPVCAGSRSDAMQRETAVLAGAGAGAAGWSGRWAGWARLRASRSHPLQRETGRWPALAMLVPGGRAGGRAGRDVVLPAATPCNVRRWWWAGEALVVRDGRAGGRSGRDSVLHAAMPCNVRRWWRARAALVLRAGQAGGRVGHNGEDRAATTCNVRRWWRAGAALVARIGRAGGRGGRDSVLPAVTPCNLRRWSWAAAALVVGGGQAGGRSGRDSEDRAASPCNLRRWWRAGVALVALGGRAGGRAGRDSEDRAATPCNVRRWWWAGATLVVGGWPARGPAMTMAAEMGTVRPKPRSDARQREARAARPSPRRVSTPEHVRGKRAVRCSRPKPANSGRGRDRGYRDRARHGPTRGMALACATETAHAMCKSRETKGAAVLDTIRPPL